MNRTRYLEAMSTIANTSLKGTDLDLRINQILHKASSMSNADFVSYISSTKDLWKEQIGTIGEGMKHHFHCIFCKITFHLNFMPKFCIWCGTPAIDPKLKLPNFIDVDHLRDIAKQIHDVQR